MNLGHDTMNQSLYGGQFTLSTQLINPKFCVSRPYRRSTTVSLETNPLVQKLNAKFNAISKRKQYMNQPWAGL